MKTLSRTTGRVFSIILCCRKRLLLVSVVTGRDVWIAIFLECIAIPLLAIYARLHITSRQRPLIFLIHQESFWENSWYFILRLQSMGAYAKRFWRISTTVALTETLNLFSRSFRITCAWGVKEGIEVLGRWSSIFCVLCYDFVTLTLISPEIELKHLQPFFYYE